MEYGPGSTDCEIAHGSGDTLLKHGPWTSGARILYTCGSVFPLAPHCASAPSDDACRVVCSSAPFCCCSSATFLVLRSPCRCVYQKPKHNQFYAGGPTKRTTSWVTAKAICPSLSSSRCHTHAFEEKYGPSEAMGPFGFEKKKNKHNTYRILFEGKIKL